MSKPTFKITSDFTENFNAIINVFKQKETLVGIPEQKGERKDNAPINNAALLYLNEYGSPLQHIPPRPVMSIGLKSVKDEIAELFRQAAIQALTSSDKNAMDIYYKRAGFIGSSAVKMAIDNQLGIDPPAEATLKTRKSQGFKGTKALVVSGQMRNSITYVVSNNGEFKKVGG